MTPRLSVIVAAYNSPAELDMLVSSLDAQTLPQRDFEVFFVDDGSTDGTLERLRTIALSRPNYRVASIPNSGWPGRPRNVALAQTDADWVFFADHDDYFFPSGLQAALDFGDSVEADVVHPKEAVHGWRTPGWDSWREQLPSLQTWRAQDVRCITPHKLYRTDFLKRHGIVFPEGRIRLEDFSFNADVWARTDRVAIFAQAPVYKWMIYDNNSHKGGYDYDVYWRSFEGSLQPILSVQDETKRLVLLERWYRSRILERLGPQFKDYSENYRASLMQTFAGLMHYFPVEVDALLTPTDRLRSVLLRQQRAKELLDLARLDAHAVLKADVSRLSWDSSGRLDIRYEVRLMQGDQEMLFTREGETVRRTLGPELDQVFDDDVRDVSADLGTMWSEVVIRARTTDVDWSVPGQGNAVWVPTTEGQGHVVFEGVATIDPAVAAYGAPLDDDVWDTFIRINGLGFGGAPRLRIVGGKATAAVVHGRPFVAYRTKTGALAIDLCEKVRTVVGTGGARAESVYSQEGTRRVALPNTRFVGDLPLRGTFATPSWSAPATVEADGRDAVLVIHNVDQPLADGRVTLLGARSAVLWGTEVDAYPATLPQRPSQRWLQKSRNALQSSRTLAGLARRAARKLRGNQ